MRRRDRSVADVPAARPCGAGRHEPGGEQGASRAHRENDLTTSQSDIPDSAAKTAGMSVGRQTATAILQRRANDPVADGPKPVRHRSSAVVKTTAAVSR